MSCSSKRRDYHDRRKRVTADKLGAALERMRTGKTVRLAPGYKWTKQSWSDEAGVSKDTAVKKERDGTFRFPKETEIYEALKAGSKPHVGKVERLMNEIAALRDENMRLKKALADRGNDDVCQARIVA